MATIRLEAFQLASTDVCATGLRTKPRHACDFVSASWPLSARSATAFGCAFASCHGSRLLTLRLLFAHKPAVFISTSPTWWKVFTDPAENSCPSQCLRSLCPAVGRLSFGRSRVSRTARVTSIVLAHSRNRYPLGNCDSLKLETSLSYLTRLGAVSDRS